MLTRIVVGVTLGVGAIMLFLFGTDWMVATVLAAALTLGVYELLADTGLTKRRIPVAAAMVMPAIMTVFVYLRVQPMTFYLLFFVFFILLFVEGMLSRGAFPFTTVCVALAAGVAIPLLFLPILPIFRMQYGRVLIFLTAVLPVGSDTGGLFVGRTFGRNLLAPEISPAKTREGAVGSVFGSVVGACLIGFIVETVTGLTARYALLVVLGVVCSVLAQVGDLFMSFVKREFGIKDFGTLLPGHGGVYDRLDSWMLCLPVLLTVFGALPPFV